MPDCLVPPGRLERPHPAPEAGALSAELWGLIRCRLTADSSVAHPATGRKAPIFLIFLATARYHAAELFGRLP